MNLNECLNEFLKDRACYCSEISVSNYRNTIGYFITWLQDVRGCSVDDIDADSITLDDLQKYSIFLKSKPKSNIYGSVNGCISSRTRKDYLKDLKTFFTFLQMSRLVNDSPASLLKLPKVHDQPLEVLTADEVYIIDDCFNGHSYYGCRNLAVVHLLLDAGLRAGEVKRLRLPDLHFDSDYIVIKNSKGGKGRCVPMSRIVKKYLKRYIDDFRPETSCGIVFVSASGDPITQDAIKSMFDRLKAKSGIIRLYPHLLRHTFATSFILGGGSLEFLRIYMGHSSIETTEKYLHIANNMRFMTNVYKLDSSIIQRTY